VLRRWRTGLFAKVRRGMQQHPVPFTVKVLYNDMAEESMQAIVSANLFDLETDV